MPRSRLVALVALGLALVSCSRSSGDTEILDATVPSVPTTVTTTAAPATTTTTAATTTTTVAPTTTTTLVAAEAPPSAPTNVLDSFEWQFATSIGAVDTNLLSLSSTGVFVDGDLSCRITTGFGGFDFETGVIVVGDQTFLDSGTGEGYQTVSSNDPAFRESLGLCAGSDRFWADITGGEELPAGGETEERNGIATRRLDLGGLIDQAGALGLVAPGVEGVEFDELTFWVAEDGEWISSLSMRATLEPETLQDITGSTISDTGEIAVSLDVTMPNDSGLSVSLP